jgi:hypothetical protein
MAINSFTANAKPQALKVQPENIPESLKQLNRWVVWGYQQPKGNNKKWRKVPMSSNGGSGRVNDSSTWATFEKVLRRLKKYQGWESIKKSRDTVYQADQGLRLTIDEDSGNQFQITKKKLYKSDFSIKEKPFDVRFSVSSENPVVDIPDVEYNRVRQRTRESFLRRGWGLAQDRAQRYKSR